MIPAREDHATGRTVLDRNCIAVLSSGLLQAVMNTYGEDSSAFAARAGVAVDVIAAVAGGTYPAWALPYDEFMALASAVAALWPSAAFEIATACDLLLTSVLDGDHYMATDVLTDPSSQALAQELLRAAGSKLPEALRALLRERSAELDASGSPDAWVGEQILTGCLGRQS